MAVGRFRRGSSHVQRGAILTCLAQRIMCEFDPTCKIILKINMIETQDRTRGQQMKSS